MRRNLSVFIDLLRVVAAFAVMLSHARAFVMPRGMPSFLAAGGSEAVAVFFVLSGFVIRFVSLEKGEDDWRAYAGARIARLYPVVVLALAVTLLADAVGRWWSPAAYAAMPGFAADVGALDVLRVLTFTNETWYDHVVFGSNEPLWSLGFEAPYYLLFGALLFVPTRWRIAAFVAWTALVGPKILLYLPLWLLGAAAYDLHRRTRAVPRLVGAAGLVAAGAIAAAAKLLLLGGRSFAAFRSFDAAYMIDGATYYLAIAIAAAVALVSFDVVARDRPLWPPRVASAIAWLAGGSFTLYLVHLPLLAAARAFLPAADRPAYGAAAIAAACVAAYALAEVAERRKRVFRRAVDAVLGVGRRSRISPAIHPVAPPTALL